MDITLTVVKKLFTTVQKQKQPLMTSREECLEQLLGLKKLYL